MAETPLGRPSPVGLGPRRERASVLDPTAVLPGSPTLDPALTPDLPHLVLPTLEDQSGLPKAQCFRSGSRRGRHSATWVSGQADLGLP